MGLNHGGGIHMFDQKDTTGILVGIGAAVAVGLGVFAFFASSEEAREKAEALVNRQRAKHLVRSKFNGNKTILKAVDKLGDKEVNNLLAVLDKADNFGDSVSDSMSDAKKYITKKLIK